MGNNWVIISNSELNSYPPGNLEFVSNYVSSYRNGQRLAHMVKGDHMCAALLSWSQRLQWRKGLLAFIEG